MSFLETTFSFDGISCEEFGLMLYNIGSNTQDAAAFSTTAEITEDRIAKRYRSLFYGATVNAPLEFKLVFGLRPNLYESGTFFDRSDFQKIASWLTGHTEYKWLTIDQEDLFGVSYRCFIQDLQELDVAVYPCAFSCSVVCDSPYGYLPQKTQAYSVDGENTVDIWSESSMNDPYYPVLKITPHGTENIRITNLSDRNRTFALRGIPPICKEITIDCENQIIKEADGLNLYSGCNFIFPRLIRGINRMKLEGSADFAFVCHFPVNVGS